jgi:DNA-binding beta-propeller fold protein YncE
MRHPFHLSLFLAGAFAAAASNSGLHAQPPAPAGSYRVVKRIPVGGEGGWDYAMVDPAARRLYVSHATKMVVIDIDRDSVVGELGDTPGIHGVAIAPEFGRGFTSNGRDTSVTIFDLKTLAQIARVKVTGANPDAIAYDDASKRVFTFNGRGNNATALDAKTGKVVGTIALAGKPEFAQTDGKGLLFVNIETDPGQIQVIDTKTLKLARTYPLTGCDGPSGLAYDRARNRLFSVCGNSVMAVSDPTSGKVVELVPIGAGVDAVSFDPATGLVLASNGEDGTMSVVHQDAADKYTSLANVPTQRGSRTMTLDPKTHRVYMASVQYGPVPAATAQQPRPRAATIPGSFTVLVLDRK